MSTHVLISGASFAGLATAYWMRRRGYEVTVVEISPSLKKGGTPVNIQERTVGIVQRMGLLEQIRVHAIVMERMEFKNSDDETLRSDTLRKAAAANLEEEYEIERDVLLQLLYDSVRTECRFVFGDSVACMTEAENGIDVAFKSGASGLFDLVFGCDGIHSIVRKLWFGEESQFARFLHTYFSIAIVDALLIPENTIQMYNEPGKSAMLNAYNEKTDIVLCFHADEEIPYDYRSENAQRRIVADRFAGSGWRTAELLQRMMASPTFYFDKLCQMHMPSWSRGRVALVGDAAYCASPAAGRGGSLALDGAAALADAFERCADDFTAAFADYNTQFRPFIEQVQADVVAFGLDMLIPRTEDAIRQRNARSHIF